MQFWEFFVHSFGECQCYHTHLHTDVHVHNDVSDYNIHVHSLCKSIMIVNVYDSDRPIGLNNKYTLRLKSEMKLGTTIYTIRDWQLGDGN